MNTNDVSFIIDKLSATLSGAVDKAQPLAQEIVHQYALGRTALAIGFGIFGAILGMIAYNLWWSGMKMADEHECSESQASRFVPAFVLGFGSIICICVSIVSACEAMSPITSLMGK